MIEIVSQKDTWTEGHWTLKRAWEATPFPRLNSEIFFFMCLITIPMNTSKTIFRASAQKSIDRSKRLRQRIENDKSAFKDKLFND